MIDESGYPAKMLFMKVTLFFCMLLGTACLAVAQAPAGKTAKKPAARQVVVPEQLLSAKSLCVKVLIASDADQADARKELKSWGHFAVVEDCKQAEVTLLISSRVFPETEACGSTIQVVGNPDSSILWTGSLKCKRSTKGLVARLVRAMRHDVEASHSKPAPEPPAKPSSERPKP